MSRCYSYPPPGYERRANVGLGLSPKKERHKHKGKKKKRRKESESIGDLPLDLDKRARKAQQSRAFKELSLLANGSLPGTLATPSEAVPKTAAQRVQAVVPNDEKAQADLLAINGKGFPSSGRQKSQLSLLSIKAVCNSNGAARLDAASSSSIYAKAETEKHTQYLSYTEKAWSTVDDQDWLFHEGKLFQPEPGYHVPSPLVWAEALFLPSVGVYALPYVVPD